MEIKINEIMEENKERITSEVIEGITAKVIDAFNYRLNQESEEIINDFIVKQVVPAIKKQLNENRNKIVGDIIKALEEILSNAGVKLGEILIKNIRQIRITNGTFAFFNIL